MASKAALIDFLASSRFNPATGKLWDDGAIVAFFSAGTATAKAVWADRDKTLPTTDGLDTTKLGADGSVTVYGDGVYDIKIYDSEDTGLTTPLKTFSSVNVADSTLNATLTDPTFLDGVDATKIAAWDMATISTGTTRTFTLPDEDGILVTRGSGTTLLQQKVVEIGDWNMDATGSGGSLSVDVAHGLTYAGIRPPLSVLIRNDTDTSAIDFATSSNVSFELFADATNIHIEIDAASVFDNATFNSTSFNRGWILVTYVE